MKIKKLLITFLAFAVLSVCVFAACEHTHTYSDEWTYDATYHWHAATCDHTDEKGELAEHTWNSGTVTTPATHTANGVMTYACTVCGYKKTETIPALSDEHTYSSDWSKDETYHWHAATCGHDAVSGKAEHTWDNGTDTTPATHTENGVKTYTCTVCGQTKTETIPALSDDHTYSSDWSKDETYHWHAATCGHDAVSGKAVHTWNEGEVTTPATHTENGVKTYTCTVCGQTKTETIPANTDEHTYSDEWTYDETEHWHAATCGHDAVSGKAVHTWNSGTVTTPATHTENGVKTFTCTVCGQTKTETIPALSDEHTYSSDWSKDETYHWHAATCGHNVTSGKAVHTWNEGEVTTPATHTENGVKTYTCTVCGQTKTETIPANTDEHTYSDEWTYDETYHWHAATCGHDVTSGKAVHTYGEWTYNSEALTYTKTCSVCSKTVTVTAGAEEGFPVLLSTAADCQSVSSYTEATVKYYKLTADITLTSTLTVSEGASISLDLNGYTLTDGGFHTITNNGTLTITDGSADKTGKVDNVTHAKAALFNNGVATLLSGTYTRSGEKSTSTGNAGGNSYYVLLNYGTLTIGAESADNANIFVRYDSENTYGKFSSLIENGWYNGNENTSRQNSVLVIWGGTFTGGKYTVKSDDYGVTTINGGTFSGAAEYAALNWNVLTITGGSFTATFGAVLTGKSNDTSDKGETTITGGSFTGILQVYSGSSGSPKYEVSGGAYSVKPEESYIAEGYIVYASDDIYEVIAAEDAADAGVVASIGKTGYTSLQDAITAAQADDTIVLLSDVTVTSTLTVSSTVTLDLNGHTVTFKDPDETKHTTSAFGVTGENVTFTIKDDTSDKNGTIISSGYGVVARYGSSVVVTSGTIATYWSALTSNNTTGAGNFTVSGGTLSAAQGPAIYMPAQGTLNVTGGTLQGGIIARMGTINISGGTIYAATDNLDSIKQYYNYSGSVWLGGALTLIAGTYSFTGGNGLTVNVTGGTFVNEYNGEDSQFANGITVYMMGKVAQEVKVSVSGATFNLTKSGAKDVIFVDVERVVGTGFDTSYSNTGSICNVPTYNEKQLIVIGGTEYYESLSAALEAVPTDNTETTIVLLSDVTGSGVKVQANKKIVFDLNNHVYKVDNAVGSTGTETNGFQLLIGSTVTFKNGSLAAYGSQVKILIQNYCNLTLDSVKLYADENNTVMQYALSSNHGTVTITGSTEITAREDATYGYAVDIMFWDDREEYSADGTQLTFDANFTGKVTGKIAVGGYSGTQNPGTKLQFIIAAGCQGTFDVTFSTYNLTFNKNIVISGGTFKSSPDVSYIADGYEVTESDGNYTVTAKVGDDD